MRQIAEEADLREAVGRLIGCEPRFAKVVENHGLPPLRREPAGLKTLLRIITDQLISLRAAEAIWARLTSDLPGLDAASILAVDAERLRALGLSSAKVRAFQAAAAADRDGVLEHLADPDLADDDITHELLRISGIGPWSAAIYMLTALGRSDAWPGGDLALQIAAMDLFGLDRRPDARRMMELAGPWRPRRSVAARLLWSHYRGLKGLAQIST